MFEILEEPKKKLKIFGQEYEVATPSANDVLLLTQKIESNKQSNATALEAMLEILLSSGLPKDVVDRIPSSQVGPLSEYILGSKKN